MNGINTKLGHEARRAAFCIWQLFWQRFSVRSFVSVLFVLMAASPAPAADELTAEAVLKATGVSGGWIMHIGTNSGALEVALGKDDRFTVTGVAQESASADKARELLRKADLLGKVHIHEPLEKSKVPTKSDTLSLLICDMPCSSPNMEWVARVFVFWRRTGGTRVVGTSTAQEVLSNLHGSPRSGNEITY